MPRASGAAARHSHGRERLEPELVGRRQRSARFRQLSSRFERPHVVRRERAVLVEGRRDARAAVGEGFQARKHPCGDGMTREDAREPPRRGAQQLDVGDQLDLLGVPPPEQPRFRLGVLEQIELSGDAGRSDVLGSTAAARRQGPTGETWPPSRSRAARSSRRSFSDRPATGRAGAVPMTTRAPEPCARRGVVLSADVPGTSDDHDEGDRGQEQAYPRCSRASEHLTATTTAWIGNSQGLSGEAASTTIATPPTSTWRTGAARPSGSNAGVARARDEERHGELALRHVGAMINKIRDDRR